MRSTDKGTIGVGKAIASLTALGYAVSVPINGACSYDLVAEKDGKFKRVQVKYRKLSSKGKLVVDVRTTCLGGTTRARLGHRANTGYDLLCVYCPDTDLCYYRHRDGIFNPSIDMTRAGSVADRESHTLDQVGSIPTPATIHA